MVKASRTPLAAINNSWRLCPGGPDVLYGCDWEWWEAHDGVPGFQGLRLTISTAAAKVWGARLVRHRDVMVMSDTPAWIGTGGNGGFQMLNFAALAGARRVLLTGFDMQATGGRTHWHGNHTAPRLNNPDHDAFRQWRSRLAAAAPVLARLGCEVINCSRDTALTCFPRARLEDMLCGSR
ncbi:hypothetical protein [Pyruvatibacter mobilis]|uniref:hypothetical protein n=1 Tax=Pyruvatibacter mobilis TaxID=1712261 RepID=UPI003BAC67A3